MSYQTQLPMIFPHVVRVRQDIAAGIAATLMSPSRTDVPQGSSFAITVDNWDGTVNLWLSRASHDFVQENFSDVLNL